MRSRRQRRLKIEAHERSRFRCVDCEWSDGYCTGSMVSENAARRHAEKHGHYVTFYFEGQGAFDYRPRIPAPVGFARLSPASSEER